MSNFKQDFSVQLLSIFQRAGIALSIDQIEGVRKTADGIVALIEQRAKERAVELIRQMQVAVGDGFNKIGQDMDKLEARIQRLEDENPTVG